MKTKQVIDTNDMYIADPLKQIRMNKLLITSVNEFIITAVPAPTTPSLAVHAFKGPSSYGMVGAFSLTPSFKLSFSSLQNPQAHPVF